MEIKINCEVNKTIILKIKKFFFPINVEKR